EVHNCDRYREKCWVVSIQLWVKYGLIQLLVKIGEQLKLDVLLPDAHQVMHQNKSSTEWKKVWKRDSKSRVNVAYSRLTDSDGTLTIKEFTSDDAGAYRVLGYEGEILITVTVTDEKSSNVNKNRMQRFVNIINPRFIHNGTYRKHIKLLKCTI
uniref:Immunoglobulin subtype domain-containing protein n=1 Tax=Sinocyclocheilus grahami TaxID=75366 RepID=A0A672M6C0_SINGR